MKGKGKSKFAIRRIPSDHLGGDSLGILAKSDGFRCSSRLLELAKISSNSNLL
jgi:hypothetical protein